MAVAAMLVSKSLLLSIDFDDDDDETFSVTAFIILYGFDTRNDLGKYCKSTDDVYSGVVVSGCCCCCCSEGIAAVAAVAAVVVVS